MMIFVVIVVVVAIVAVVVQMDMVATIESAHGNMFFPVLAYFMLVVLLTSKR